MTEKLKKTTQKAPSERKATKSRDKKEKLMDREISIWSLLCSFVLIFISAFLLVDSIAVSVGKAVNTFRDKVTETSSEVSKKIYQISYDYAEKMYHVSNRATIELGDIQMKSNLEVLQVSDVYYEILPKEKRDLLGDLINFIPDLFKEDTTLWLEVPCEGVFTVNLQTAEFITDPENAYVLVRLFEPEITNFRINYDEVECQPSEKVEKLNGDVKFGADKAREVLKDADLQMKQKLKNDPELFTKAKEFTKTFLTSLIKELNPDFENLTVDIEFME
ncbi:MAG: hypothetical protein ACI32N_07830 [Bulleidia sp.]